MQWTETAILFLNQHQHPQPPPIDQHANPGFAPRHPNVPPSRQVVFKTSSGVETCNGKTEACESTFGCSEHTYVYSESNYSGKYFEITDYDPKTMYDFGFEAKSISVSHWVSDQHRRVFVFYKDDIQKIENFSDRRYSLFLNGSACNFQLPVKCIVFLPVPEETGFFYFYHSTNYFGHPIVIKQPGNVIRAISSMQIPKGYRVELYKDMNFKEFGEVIESKDDAVYKSRFENSIMYRSAKIIRLSDL